MRNPPAGLKPPAVKIGILTMALAAALAAPGQAADPLRDLVKQLEQSIRAGAADQALSQARSIANLGGEKAAEVLFIAGMKAELPAIFNGLAKILAGMKDEGALKFFEKESHGRVEQRLIYLVEILGQMKTPNGALIAAKMLDTRSVVVLRSALAALVQLRMRECVEPLIDLVERFEKARDRGLLYQEARDALYEITGEDFDTYADWRKWWDPVKGTYTPGKKEEGATRVVRKPREKAPEFVGRKIFSKNVIFVIDSSGTMQYVMKDDIPGLSKGDGSDSGGVVQGATDPLTPENERLARFWTRMEMAKRELIKALTAFAADAKVNILEFNIAVRKFEKRSALLQPKIKTELIARVKQLKWVMVPGTNTLKALEETFASDLQITDIYFLSDGLPSADGKKNDDPMPLLDKVEALNRFRKVKVHTFGYDPVRISDGIEDPQLARANEFLKKLAERTGGTFTLLKVTDEKPPPDFK